MRIVLTGGCTGGHIYPALAIGDKFKEKNPDCEIIYIAHQYGLETEIVPDAGYELKIVTAEWLDRSNLLRAVKTLAGTEKGKLEAYRILKKFKPDFVISTGSFVSVPVVLAAHKYGCGIYIHEQNAFPGLSNKALSKYARRIFLGFEDGADMFQDKSKLVYSGNPVRREFYGRDRTVDRKRLGIPENDTVIAIFGGSLGASAINEIGVELSVKYNGAEGITILFGTGREYYQETMRELEQSGIKLADNVRITPYIDDMYEVLSASNLVISRSGALSVAEITMSGRAAIFIPSPNVTADHQYYNAKAVADNGGAIIIREDATASSKAMGTIAELLAEKNLIEEMEKASAELAPVNATDIIYNTIMEDYVGLK